MKAMIRERARLIRLTTPNILEELFEMSNRKCDLCGFFIQDLTLAELEHSTPVIHFARNLDLSIEDAIQQANHPSNLRVVHYGCNSSKGGRMTREEWFARGLDKKIGEPKIFTEDELLLFKFRLGVGGRTQVGKNVESGHLERMRNLPQTKAAQRIHGRKAFESGQLAGGCCLRWNIRRGKPCVCGRHLIAVVAAA
jgi:hypothetical protein